MKDKIITIIPISFFAIALWVFVSFSGEYFTTLSFPLKVTGFSETQALASQTSENVTINLKGQGWILAQLTFGRDPEFLIPVRVKNGKQIVNLRNEVNSNNWLSTSLQIVDIEPAKLEFEIENLVEKKVKIEQNVRLKFKENYGLVSNLALEPDSTIIVGPASLVKKIEIIKTVNTEFVNLDKPFLSKIELENLEYISYKNPTTTLEFDVQKIVDKTFAEVEVEVEEIPLSRQLLLFPGKISVVLRGGINLLGKLTNEDIKAKINYKDAVADTLGGIIPEIIVPTHTKLIDIKPNKLEYIIKQF